VDDGDETLESIRVVVRQVVSARVPSQEVDDLAHETMTRVLAASSRVEPSALPAYAAATARHVVADWYRAKERSGRIAPKLLDLRQPSTPEEEEERRTDRVAMASALGTLSLQDRRLVERHHLEDAPIAELAGEAGGTEMAARVRLSRIRARLRVAFVLAASETKPRSDACQPTLVALTSGDRRAQRRLGAREHLAECSACSHWSSEIAERRSMLGLALPALAGAWRGTSRGGRSAIGVGAGAVVLAAVTVAAAGVSSGRASEEPPSRQAASAPATTQSPTTARPPARLATRGRALPAEAEPLRSQIGRSVVADGVTVLAVPADEGFWVQADDGGQIWVQLVTPGSESIIAVEEGMVLDFEGTVVAHGPEFVALVGISANEGSSILGQQGAHLEVDAAVLRPR